MVEQILPNLYRIEVPLPNNPLKALNAYVIKGPQRNLMIDTGLNMPECLEAAQQGLAELGVDLRQTDFFITHFHSDHLALAATLATRHSIVYFGERDAALDLDSWDSLADDARHNGFPNDQAQEAMEAHPGFKYGPAAPVHFTTVKEDDPIEVGDYRFACVATPGHTQGHMCLYEPNHRILISGDHVLGDITPNISCWNDAGDPLREYLNSLDKILAFDVRLVLPGHRSLILDCEARIRELKDHHARRADESLSILRDGSQTAYEVASRLSWDMTYDSWERFPTIQRWFALTEALAHLRYLEGRGLVRREPVVAAHGGTVDRYRIC